MRTLEHQKQRLEGEIMSSKTKIWQIRDSEFVDLNALNQLRDTIERNMQLINMIDQHLGAGQEHRVQQSG